ncbi:hypothetical protein [Paraglaciecola sp. 2405UD69-4]|uniref:hypothetical protein n=1 Tax=Paraglaciecola sp. 2405UD69-4 TaxID=3391836 RepID=UPI0039C9F332
MKLKFLFVPVLFLMTSCELLKTTPQENTQTQFKQTYCIWKVKATEADCDIHYWLGYWGNIENIDWPERKAKIDTLSDSDADVLRKVILSQGKSTPYQNRLRAQMWAESVFPKLNDSMRTFLEVALYTPSQSLLELESALVTLSKINTQKVASIEERRIELEQQKKKLQEQQHQIEQLLNIEASMIKNGQEDK